MMLKRLLNFSDRRTPVAAMQFYLAWLLVGLLVGLTFGAVVGAAGGMEMAHVLNMVVVVLFCMFVSAKVLNADGRCFTLFGLVGLLVTALCAFAGGLALGLMPASFFTYKRAVPVAPDAV